MLLGEQRDTACQHHVAPHHVRSILGSWTSHVAVHREAIVYLETGYPDRRRANHPDVGDGGGKLNFLNRHWLIATRARHVYTSRASRAGLVGRCKGRT